MPAESKKAIVEDIVEDETGAIILGYTGMIGVAKELQETLGIPVIDPAVASMKLAERLVGMKISHSKLVYPKPPEKERRLNRIGLNLKTPLFSFLRDLKEKCVKSRVVKTHSVRTQALNFGHYDVILS